ncbi:hypothetical protein Tco_0809381 [Tanacetum coccineum]
MSFREDYKALHSRVRYLESGMRTREHENVVTCNGVNQVRRCMDAYDVDLGFIEQDATEDLVKGCHWHSMRKPSLRIGMDPIKVAEAITEYERNRTNLENAGGAGGAGGSGNARGEPELRVEVMLEIYHGATDASHTIMVKFLQSAGNFRGDKGHYRDKCPKKKDQQNEGAHGRAYVMRTEEPQKNLNVVTGMFLLNDHYASILFDSGAEKSFVSTTFTPFIDIIPTALDTS